MLAQLGWTQSPENLIQMAADLNKTWLNLGVRVQNLNPCMQCLSIIPNYNIPLARFSSGQGLLGDMA